MDPPWGNPGTQRLPKGTQERSESNPKKHPMCITGRDMETNLKTKPDFWPSVPEKLSKCGPKTIP